MAAPAEASDCTIEPGHTIGPYKLTREIGKGSFAVVYQAKVQQIQPNVEGHSKNVASQSSRSVTRVAIKIVTRKKLTPRLLENLEGEIAILRTARHPNIVELLDCLKTEAHIYLVMQYCRMGDLSNFIRSRKRGSTSNSGRNAIEHRVDAFEEEMDKLYPHPHDGGLNSDIIRSFVTQLASALEFMRHKNIVHRDIKPQNILLQEPDQDLVRKGHAPFIPQIKVADFGFARHLQNESLAETLCGSPLYMAPEILRYERYDAKADLWSVGAVMYEMCVGKTPFRASNHVELLRRIDRTDDKFKFPDEKNEESLRRDHARRVEEGRETSAFVPPHVVDEDIKVLIRKLLRKRPIERIGFEEFFSCDLIVQKDKKASTLIAQVENSSSTPQATSTHNLQSTRIAPAVPTSSNTRGEENQQGETDNENGEAGIPPASPAPTAPFQRHYFNPRYIVGGLQNSVRATQSSHTQTNTTEANLPIERERNTPENLSSTNPVSTPVEQKNDGDTSSLEDNVLATPGSSTSHLPATGHEKDSATVSTGATATVSDSVKRSGANDDDRGYVMVDRRNVDVNALAAEESANRVRMRTGSTGVWSPLGVVRRPSQQLGRLASLSGISPLAGLPARSNQTTSTSPTSTTKPLVSNTNAPVSTTSRIASSNMSGPSTSAATPVPVSQSIVSTNTGREGFSSISSSPILNRLATTPPNAPFAIPANARKPSFSRRPSSQNEGSRLSALRPPQSPRPALNQLVPSSAPTVNNKNVSSNGLSNISPTRSTPPSLGTSQQGPSVLQRAISMASIRLFGVPTGTYMRGSGIRKPLRMGVSPNALLSSSPVQAGVEGQNQFLSGGDITEQNLLALMYDYDRKSFVLSEFADARLSVFFTDGPHQNNYLDRRRNSSSSLSSVTSGSMTKATVSSTGGEKAESGSSGESKRVTPGEIAASEAYVLYFRSLSFLKRAICTGRDFIESRSTSASRYSTSHTNVESISPAHQEIYEAIQCLQAKFFDGNERANFARSKSIEEMPESAQNIDRIIFDEALQIAKRAALDELNDQRTTSEDLNILAERNFLYYETAYTMLQSLLDPAETEKELPINSINTIEQFLGIINRRMVDIQRKFGTSS